MRVSIDDTDIPEPSRWCIQMKKKSRDQIKRRRWTQIRLATADRRDWVGKRNGTNTHSHTQTEGSSYSRVPQPPPPAASEALFVAHYKFYTQNRKKVYFFSANPSRARPETRCPHLVTFSTSDGTRIDANLRNKSWPMTTAPKIIPTELWKFCDRETANQSWSKKGTEMNAGNTTLRSEKKPFFLHATRIL